MAGQVVAGIGREAGGVGLRAGDALRVGCGAQAAQQRQHGGAAPHPAANGVQGGR